MTIRKILAVLFFLFLIPSCNKNNESLTDLYEQPEYWKNLALTNILPWTQHVIDSANGSFFSTLNEDWQPIGDTIRYPSMIARNLFGFSVAYLLSGDDVHINMAHRLKEYLLEHALDKKYGGWYDAISPEGSPVQVSKSTFVQVYVITGLAMYYLVTHDAEVLEYINKSNALLEEKAWDHKNGGYFDNLAQDWSLLNEVKSFSSQLAPVSGYLLYLYMATRNTDYLTQSERILDTVLANMVDPKTNWILESFDKDWNYLAGHRDENEINIGHNVEVSWTLLRLHMLNKQPEYLEKGKKLADSLHRYGFNATNGIWFAGVANMNPAQHTDYTHWWIQAYGHMLDLCLARLYPGDNYVASFSKGASFWHSHFLDKERGDTYLSVRGNGEVTNGQKANQFKASYHNMEHALLNYLYLAAWIVRQPVTLHFKITSSADGETLYPIPVEMFNARLKNIEINGNPELIPHEKVGGIKLPSLKDAAVKVTIY